MYTCMTVPFRFPAPSVLPALLPVVVAIIVVLLVIVQSPIFTAVCPRCSKYQWLLQHVKREHFVLPFDVQHHWLAEMAIQERNPKLLGVLEKEVIDLVWQDSGEADEEKVGTLPRPPTYV